MLKKPKFQANVKGLPKALKGHAYQKLPGGKGYYRQVNVRTGKPLKKLYKPESKKTASAKSFAKFKKLYPQFPVYLEGQEKHPHSPSEQERLQRKAVKAGRAKMVMQKSVRFKEGLEFEEKPFLPIVIFKSMAWKHKGRIITGPQAPKGVKSKFIFKFSDGSKQQSKAFAKRLPKEIAQFEAAQVKGKGTDYRPGSQAQVAPLLSRQAMIGPGSRITTTRQLVAEMLGSKKLKGNLKLAFDWRIFEGVGKKGELKGKSGGGFKFSAGKAGKAFKALYSKFVREHLADELVKRRPSLRKQKDEAKVIKAARLSRKQRASILKKLKAEGKIPQSAVALFIEMKILEAAKLRGVVISASKNFKDFKGKPVDAKGLAKQGIISQADKKWQGFFNLNLYKEKR